MNKLSESARGRSRVDNNGKPIYYTSEGIDAFWEWFGDSAIVDCTGRPQVLFHGTANDFSEFLPSDGWFGVGIYLTDNPGAASEFAEERNLSDDNGENVMPLFVAMVNPFVFHEEIEEESSDIQLLRALGVKASAINAAFQNDGVGELIHKTLRKSGYDGLIAHMIGGDVEYVVLDAGQVKSAIGNNGDFSMHVDCITGPCSANEELRQSAISRSLPVPNAIGLKFESAAATVG